MPKGLPRQVIDIPLDGSTSDKWDPRILDAPGMSDVKNARYSEWGGVQKRAPFIGLTNDSGHAMSGCRRLVTYNDELLSFTADKLYSYSSATGTWVERGDYLAPWLQESPSFQNQTEQMTPDFAEHSGVRLYAWTQLDNTGAYESYYAGIDVATGGVILSPTSMGANTRRPRVVATTNKLMLTFVNTSTGVRVSSFDPTDLASGAEGTATVSATVPNDGFDCLANGATLILAISENTQYRMMEISEARAATYDVAKSGKTSDGPIAVGYFETNDYYVVVRSSTTSMLGDILDYDTGAFSDSSVGNSLGSITSGGLNQVSVVVDQDTYETSPDRYKAHIAWSSDEATDTSSWDCEYQWINQVGGTGTAAAIVDRCGLASHVFLHDNSPFCWVAFAGTTTGDIVAAVQNSYFLYRLTDNLLVAKAISNVAGGLSDMDGHLPSVNDLGSNKFEFCGLERRLIPLGKNQQGYAAQSPRSVAVTFDSNKARRSVQLGRSLYIAGGQLTQFDGRTLAEVGFHTFPWAFPTLTDVGSGTLANGDYSYLASYKRVNAQAEEERSTTATVDSVTCAASGLVNATTMPLHVTLKGDDVAVEFWRTTVDPNTSTPYYLASSPDPSAAGTNGYLANDTTASTIGTFADSMVDATLEGKEIYPETGGLLDNIAPPACSILGVTQDRLFIAGIPGKPYTVWYSKLRSSGELAAFNDALSFELPAYGGEITALAWLNETLIVFKENSIYAVPGDGYDNAGAGNNYGPARLISSDVGASSAELVALIPAGLLFHSDKGWHLLNQGWGVRYVGAAISSYDDSTFLGMLVMEAENQVRVYTSGDILVWDWSTKSESGGVWCVWDGLDDNGTVRDYALYNGTMYQCYDSGSNDALRSEQEDFDSATLVNTFAVETPWIKVSGLQGYQSVRRLQILGEVRGSGKLRVQVAYNYEESDSAGVTWVDDKKWTISPTGGTAANVGRPLTVRHTPSRRKCSAIKVRISDIASNESSEIPGEAFALSGLSLEIGVKRGPWRQLAAAQKQ